MRTSVLTLLVTLTVAGLTTGCTTTSVPSEPVDSPMRRVFTVITMAPAYDIVATTAASELDAGFTSRGVVADSFVDPDYNDSRPLTDIGPARPFINQFRPSHLLLITVDERAAVIGADTGVGYNVRLFDVNTEQFLWEENFRNEGPRGAFAATPERQAERLVERILQRLAQRGYISR